MLKEILKKLEINSNDTLKTAFIKGGAEGFLDGLVILGAVSFAAGMIAKHSK